MTNEGRLHAAPGFNLASGLRCAAEVSAGTLGRQPGLGPVI